MEMILLLIISCFWSFCDSQDVVTCNGVIRSDHTIDFTQINIQLFTKSGALRETSDCSPTNGYFLLPIYDKGEYIVKVAPPTGWSFVPDEVIITVDGTSDICSKKEDIVFSFNGFSISGQINTIGESTGPSGVTVRLLESDTNKIIQERESVDEGRYWFNSVLPAAYLIYGTHSVWNINKDPVKITVTNDNVVVPVGSITVNGFDVKGHIKSNGEPVPGVQFLLYYQNGSESVKFDCSTGVVASGDTPPCIAVSDDTGMFSYLSLPPGNYKLIPRYENDKNEFQVVPIEAVFSIYNDSLILKPAFEVHGFTVYGRVLKGRKDDGLEGVKIELAAGIETVTGKDGHFRLTNVTAGTYTIKVQSSSIQFDPVTIDITPSNPQLSDITPSRYSVCGHVTVTVHPVVPFKVESCTVESTSTEGFIETAAVDSEGQFCFMLPPGKYNFRVHVPPEESERGLVLVPAVLPVTVETSVVADLEFGQFTSLVTGTISCINHCKRTEIALQRLNASVKNVQSVQAVVNGSTSSFAFNNVLPGKYKVHLITQLQWCWSKEEIELEVLVSDKVPPVHFTQTGYLLVIFSSHETHVDVFSGDIKVLNFTATKGLNNMCFAEYGEFNVIPKSCHQFDGDMYMFLTALPAPLTFTAVTHTLDVLVIVPIDSDSLNISLVSNVRNDRVIEPASSEAVDGRIVLKFSFIEKPGAVVELTPQSASLLCSPEKLVHTVGDDCPEEIPSFKCDKGFFISGRIDPPLGGVSINITTGDAGAESIVILTDENGQYRAGPFTETANYSVVPSYDMYVFEVMESDRYSFKAMKKSQMQIKIIDSVTSLPLSDVLVSVSGSNMRCSNKTVEDGVIVHKDIAPGEYYIKPILREYEFQPSSKVINLEQSETLLVEFLAKRVAFSCTGRVYSLNGTPLKDVRVKVKTEGVENVCNSFHDTGVTDEGGYYKFRALQPSCPYQLLVETDESSSVEKSLPAVRQITLVDSDIVEENFIVIIKPTTISVTGNIVLNDMKLIGHLKIVVYDDKYMESTVNTLTPDPIGFFLIPSLPVNPSKVYYLQIENDLPSHSYKIVIDSKEISFTADVDKHITINGTIEHIESSNESNHKGSIAGIFIAIGIMFLLVNIDKILSYVQANLSR